MTVCTTKDYAKMTFYDKAHNGYYLNILINGDSISSTGNESDWCNLVIKRLKESNKISSVHNISLGGNASFSGIVNFSQNLPNDGSVYDLIFLCYGQNDVDDAEFPVMYESLVRNTIETYPRAQIISILESSQKDYTNKIKTVMKICEYYNIPYVDMIAGFKNSGYEYSDLTNDGIHPNRLGNQVYYENVNKTIDDCLNKKKRSKLPKKTLYEKYISMNQLEYITIDDLINDHGVYKLNIESPYNISYLAIDRNYCPGEYSTIALINDSQYDLSYGWNQTFEQRHIDILNRQDISLEKFELKCDEHTLKTINGIVIVKEESRNN